MRIVRQYIRIMLFVAGTLVGLQLPAVVDQYGRALVSHEEEAQRAVREFQDDADRFFDGSLEALIAHYRSSGDMVFNAGGESILELVERRNLLSDALREFRSSQLNAYLHSLLDPVADIRDEVMQSYGYTVNLRPLAIGIGLMAGLMLMLTVDLLLMLFTRPFRRSAHARL